MAFPRPFHRLVLIGTHYTDTFNTSMSIVPTEPTDVTEPSAPLLAALAPVISAAWSQATGTNLGMPQASKLTSIKLNRIGTDGRYMDDVTHEHIYTTPVAGPVNTHWPAQLATVVTLRTAVDRGLASKGRMFLPVATGFGVVTALTGLVAAADAQRVASAMAALISQINNVYNTHGNPGAGAEVGVASDNGAGMFRPVTHVTVGRVTDTMRSRRNKLREDPQSAPLP